MATFKHISSKNADYGAAEQYLTFEHDEFTMKPTLDENGRLMLREDYRIATLNCGDEDFAVACMRSNLRYGKNQKREDVKSHHYIISFDPRDAVDNGLTVDRAQALGEEFCRKQFPGHQAIVCTHPDGHNHSGNIHVHIVINSLRIEEVPFLPYMDRPADTRTGCKHRCTDAAMEYFKAEVMELCHRENLYQIDLLHGSKNRITEREYWAQRKGQAKLDKEAAALPAEEQPAKPTKFETDKEKLRQTIRTALSSAASYGEFAAVLLQQGVTVKESRGRLYTTMAMLILLVLLIFFAALGIPLAFAIGASCVTYILIYAPTFITMLPQRVWNGAYSELMIAMPLFMLAGELMNTGGITQRIINFCMELLRPIRGGLGEVNIVASMIFGGISGSSVADTSALGSILIPAMEKEGYPPEASAGITVASSTMGMIIPPSTPMIVYSMISGASVGALFVAGAVPGILIGLTQLVLVYIISAKKGWHPEKIKFDGKRAAKSLLSGIPALIMPLFIIICVSFGVCTASESAGVAVLYSMLVGFFVYKELTWKGVWEALKKTLISSSSIMLIIGFTTIFTWVLTMQKVPQTVGAFFMSLNMPAWAIALIFDVLILMIGTFIDVSPAILLLTPILLPVMVQYGFSPLQFGAMMITGLAIGLVTPPVGMCLNACNKINRMPIIEIFKGAAPYVICNVIVLISISLWGPLTTALPQLLGYSIF